MSLRRIRKLRIDGFGHWRNQEWEIHPRLQLIVGHNEAGKSTLLGFIRGIMFGFEPRNSPHRYEPSKGGPFGGSIWMEDETGLCVQIQRLGKERVSGQLTVYLPDGQTAGEDWLKEWLGRIDKQTFRQLFAFGLDDLQQVRWLKEEALTPFLYNTLAGTGISLERVQKKLAEREAELFRPRAKSGRILHILQHLDALEERCRHWRKQQEQTVDLRKRLERVNEEIGRLEQEIGNRQEQLSRLERVAQLFAPYRRLRELGARQQKAKGEPEPYQRAGDLRERLSEHEARLKALYGRREEVKRQLVETESHDRGRKDGETAQSLSGLFLALSLALPSSWWLLVQNWNGGQNLFSLSLGVILLLIAVSLALAFRRKAAKSRRERGRLAEMAERLRQEAERLNRQIEAAEHEASCLREACAIQESFGEWFAQPQWQALMDEWHRRGEGRLAAERQRLEAELAQQMQAYSARLEERGRLAQRLEALQSEAALGEAEQEAARLKAELQKQAMQWSAVVLSRAVLEEAMAVFERERQPLALQRASEYFAQLTDGRYLRILAPLGQRELLVERHDGERFPPERLSRGTVEQLLLAMRLALVEEYSGKVVLPLVMDDILVNFDPRRMASAVETITQLSRQRQVFFLTCHPHVEAAFRKALAGEDWDCLELA